MAGDLILKNVRPMGGKTETICIVGGRISSAAAPTDDIDCETIDGGGTLLLPSLVDAHMHLDKTLWDEPWRPHQPGPSRAERIATDESLRRELQGSLETRAAALVGQSVSMGTGAIRSHVDVEPELGLRHVEALLAVRAAWADKVAIQLVAFPQFGLITRPGTAEVMEAAIRAGVETVGGIDPSSIDDDAAGHLDCVFGIAERTGATIDIHLHETGEEGATSMQMICDRTTSHGMQGRVAISHAFCLGTVTEDRQGELIDELAGAGVAIVTYAPGASPVPPQKKLRKAGVTLAVGSDGVRDTWTPYGNADMLERAMMLAYRQDFRRDPDIELALDAVIVGGTGVLGLPEPTIADGSPADLILVDGETIAEAIISRAERKLVVKAGQPVAGSLLSK